MVDLDASLSGELGMLSTLRITNRLSLVAVTMSRLARPLTRWLLSGALIWHLGLLSVLELLLILGHDLNDFIAEIVGVVYLVCSLQVTSISCMMFYALSIWLWVDY